MLQQKLPQQEQGFTLAEVLIAILIASLFVAASMQAMVFATIFKVRAQEYSEATTWIQQDLEEVKSQASQYDKNLTGGIVDNNIHNLRCVGTSPETGYADGLSDRLSGRPETLVTDTGTGTDTADLSKTSRFGKVYRLRRAITPVNNTPFNVLRVNYNVVLASDSSTASCPTGAIACIYTEVIPDAALQCP